LDGWQFFSFFPLRGVLASPDFLLWSARLGWPRSVAERPARACSGRAKKSVGSRGYCLFHATFSIPATAEGWDKSAEPARSSLVASAPSSLCPRTRRKPSCALSNATPIHRATWSVLSFHRETLPTTCRALRITFSIWFVLKNVTFNVAATFKR
jgi:hypothetical protein